VQLGQLRPAAVNLTAEVVHEPTDASTGFELDGEAEGVLGCGVGVGVGVGVGRRRLPWWCRLGRGLAWLDFGRATGSEIAAAVPAGAALGSGTRGG
jgi:hypothetical protein